MEQVVVYPAIPIGGENGEVRQQPRFGKRCGPNSACMIVLKIA